MYKYPIIIIVAVFLYTGILYGSQPISGWKEIHTEHFRFIYEEKDSAAISELVTFCEDVYDLLAIYFDSFPDTVHCVVSGRSDNSNGYFQYYPDMINLEISSPSLFWMGARTENWLKILLIHELTHYIHLKYEKGFFAALSRLFGDNVKVAHTPFLFSRWMIEGISTNLETRFTSGGRGRNPFFELYYKAMALEEKFFSFPQTNYSSAYPPPGRDYIAGYILVDYLLDTYGEDIFVRIHKKYVAFPFLGVERAIIAETGKSSREIFFETRRLLTDKYRQCREIEDGEKISPDTFGDYQTPIETKKGIYCYRKTHEVRPAIVCINETGENEEVILETSLSDENSFSVNTNGDLIVFTSFDFDFRNPSSTLISSDLYEYSSETGIVRKLTEKTHLHHPALSPDANTIIAVQRSGSYSRLVEIDRVTGDVSLLFAMKETNVYHPVVSPDGKTCAFAINIRGMQDIGLLNLEEAPRYPLERGGIPESYNETLLRYPFGPDREEDYYPRFIDPDHLLFTSARNGNLALYRCGINNNKEEFALVCEDPVGAFAGCVSASRFVYTSYTTDGFCIKKKEAPRIIPVSMAVPSSESPTPPFQWRPLPEGKSYIDTPHPLFWFPVISFDDDALSHSGIGLYVTGISLLGTSFWHLLATFHPEAMQPKIDASFTFHINEIGITYALNHDYQARTADERYFQETLHHQLSLDIPLIAAHRLFISTSLAFSLGITHSLAVRSRDPFPFVNAFAAGPLSFFNQYGLLTGIRFTIEKQGGPMDFYSPMRFHTALSSYISCPFSPDSIPGFRAAGTVSINLPSPVPHNVIQPSVSGTYTAESLLSSDNPFPFSTLSSRLMFLEEKQQEEGRLLFGLDYLIPLALLDQPLILGFYMLRLEGSVYLEYTADYRFREPYFVPRRFLYGGAELTFTFGHGPFTFPFTLGAGFRYDMESRGENIRLDIVPYIMLIY
ncbi:MAG: hypothetical protein JW881_07435 [Spirochaetales bacterium]|nr:hypothetical protein [Spirochaetales bacterium]